MLTVEMLAIHESTIISISHKGIISPLGLCFQILEWWSLGSLDPNSEERWSHRPMLMDFVDTVGTAKLFIQHIMHIINVLLVTLSYLHGYIILHNDIHG